MLWTLNITSVFASLASAAFASGLDGSDGNITISPTSGSSPASSGSLSFGPDTQSDFQKRGATMGKNSTKDAQDNLQWFFGHLKSFISSRGLDVDGFDEHAPHLRKKLEEITRTVESVSLPSKHLLKQLTFCKRVFHVMVQAQQSLKFYSISGMAQHLVRSVIHLNLVLLALHNSDGVPHYRRERFPQIVASHVRQLTFWRDHFQTLEAVPLSASVMFENQFARAERTLQVMATYGQRREESEFKACLKTA